MGYAILRTQKLKDKGNISHLILNIFKTIQNTRTLYFIQLRIGSNSVANVTISKAIKLSGVSRSTFYTSYINKGRITVSSDKDGKKCIEISELLRVFGELKPDTIEVQPNIADKHVKSYGSDSFEAENNQLKKQLEEAKRREQDFVQRENWYQGQISNLTDSIKLLEAPKPSDPWWKIWK